MSGGLVLVGADLCGCPLGKLPSPELVRHFPRLPPGTHGFAGGMLPSAAGAAGQTCLRSGVLSSGERRARRRWCRFVRLSSGEASLAGVGASPSEVTSGDARLRRRYAAFSDRSSRTNIFAFSPPMSGGLVVVGADLCGCPPGKLPSPELVRHFLRLPPRTHGFAGVTLPFCGRSSRPDMHAFSHKKTIRTITILSDGADRFFVTATLRNQPHSKTTQK